MSNFGDWVSGDNSWDSYISFIFQFVIKLKIDVLQWNIPIHRLGLQLDKHFMKLLKYYYDFALGEIKMYIQKKWVVI